MERAFDIMLDTDNVIRIEQFRGRAGDPQDMR